MSIALAALVVFTAVFAFLHRTYSRKFFDITGGAQWIWAQHPMSANVPVAFFAARDFDLPASRVYTHLKLVGEPEYTLYVNGREVAGRQVGVDDKTLDLYDISELVQTGRNRIVVAVRAPVGLGGLLGSIDLAPETENWVVTDRSWKIYRRWSPELLQHDVPDLPADTPLIIGEPPVGRWNYLGAVQREASTPPSSAVAPQETFSVIGSIPTIRNEAGIAVAGAARSRATAFDFGFTKGRVRLAIDSDGIMSRIVNLRFANARDELELLEPNLRAVVFAPGERVVTTPEEHAFRYLMVFGRGNMGAEVLRASTNVVEQSVAASR
ncbi:MAG TPA: hypothetical protein VJZ00_05015 [Thermoanaerobaculia bacterium]|nr:hypothetical protein [Thermoanaerobaculia bacterium]